MVSDRDRTIVYCLAIASAATQFIYIYFWICLLCVVLTGNFFFMSSLTLVCASMAFLLEKYMWDLIMFSKYDIIKTIEEMKRNVGDDKND